MNVSVNSEKRTTSLAFASFILLGLVAGLFGVAWSAIRAEFNLPLEDAGKVLGASTLGYLFACFNSGPLARRIGSGPMFALGSLLVIVGLSSVVLSASWIVLIVSVMVTSLGTGLIDAGLNAYVAAHHSPRTMNWLHAFFGVGVTIIPAIEAEAVKANNWRLGYFLVAVVAVIITIAFALMRTRWQAPVSDTKANSGSMNIWRTMRLPQVWLGIFILFLCAGAEATPGQWGFDLFTQSRDMDANSAGFWVSIYWGSFTIGRMLFGVYMPKGSVLTLLRLCMLASAAGALLWWWNPAPIVGLAGLVVLGFAQAPLFPVLISQTPKQVGLAHAQNAIGVQVAGAGIGIAVLPGIAGFLSARFGLETVGLFVAMSLIALILLHELQISYHGAKAVLQDSGSAAD